MSTNNGQFSAGPSFLEYDRPDVRMAQLPAWLQTFAATVGEPEDDWQPEDDSGPRQLGDAPTSLAAADGDNQLASWLEEAEPDLPHDASGANGSTVDPAFMISEDDLPDWLRSIAPSEGSEAEGSAPATGSNGIRVPAVSRAWVPDSDPAGPADERASVFALLASQGSQAALPGAGEPEVAQHQFHALEQVGPAMAQVPGRPSLIPSSKPKAEGAVEDGAGSQRASRLLPILAGAALLVLVILIVLFLL